MSGQSAAREGSVRHFLDLSEIDATALRSMIDSAAAMKKNGNPPVMAGRTLAMIFEKNSTRTRFSFEAAMRQLGGDSIIATAADMQLGRGETVAVHHAAGGLDAREHLVAVVGDLNCSRVGSP